MAEEKQENIKIEYNSAVVGMNLDNAVNQIQKGSLTYCLNGAVENYDSNSIQYQNEEGNEHVLTFPEGYLVIGKHFIVEKNKHIFFLVKEDGSGSQIGYMENNDGIYRVLINDRKLNFSPTYPIHKVVHRITDYSTEIYWPDNNGRRYLDIDNIPKILRSGTPLCHPVYEDDVDINRLNIQSDFLIPNVKIKDVISVGNLVAGVYQFAVQYADESGNAYTSYYSVTNPVPIADIYRTDVNFNYNVGKSIVVEISNLDTSGQFKYINLAVIKTINGATTAELVGTYNIDNNSKSIIFSGTTVTSLSMNDIFEQYPYYKYANDVTAAQDILIWSDLTSVDRLNYQSIANKIHLQWESWRIPATENYSNEANAANLRGYLRDEVYPFEIAFLLKNGKMTDGFHIPGRDKGVVEKTASPIPETAKDFVGEPQYYEGGVGYSEYWKIYNTATVNGYSIDYNDSDNYKGPYQYGEFAYWESSEEYPCNEEVWGELAGKKIRHHKFPDVNISPIHETTEDNVLSMGQRAIYPLGVKIDINSVKQLINDSNLTKEQKEEIVGFKILRGDRTANKSIVAKGLLRNVGKYEKEGNEYYFPNYPYNDLNEDPFLNSINNAYSQLCETYEINITDVGSLGVAKVQYTSCNTNKSAIEEYTEEGVYELCSTSKPVFISSSEGTIGLATYEVWKIWNTNPVAARTYGWSDPIEGYTEAVLCGSGLGCPHTKIIHVVVGTGGPRIITEGADEHRQFIETHYPTKSCSVSESLSSIRTSTNKNRQIFNSPETSFGQPFLGNILKLESVLYGKGLAHFTEVKDEAKYKLITEAAQRKALESAENIVGEVYDATAMFTAYQAYLDIYVNGITRKNYAYSFNSIADYIYSKPVDNTIENKQRNIEVSRYLIPGVQNINNDKINNYNRESSVYIKIKEDILFPDEVPNVNIKENSRFTISSSGSCDSPGKERDITVVSYYASLKNEILNQWGQIYSYPTIDTGYQVIFDSVPYESTIFGGDTFIGKFSFKTKVPFFTDNRVNAPNDSDIFYDEIGNIAYPKYWHSSRSILKDYTVKGGGTLYNIISYKAHNFDCPNDEALTTPQSSNDTNQQSSTDNSLGDSLTYYDGYFYLFAYGIPNFYCESSYNLDLRQAFNNREGDFFPHVSSGIPDDWVQEKNVPIAQDNTYYYNTSFSKQNKETNFTHLPIDWNNNYYTNYPFRAIYSDPQYTGSDSRLNNWRIYKAISYFDFPQNNGKLISLDGIQNRAILARFENKTLLYNNLLTVDTSNPQSAYFGNPNLFQGAPPIDYADTDLGFVGTQHKMLLKIPQGQISVDAKRGQVFLIQGTEVTDLSQFGSGMNRFFTDHLAFEILRYFPDVDVDNNFTGIGLHGVFDSKYDRIIITKLDYIPIEGKGVKYDSVKKEFYIEKTFDINTCNLSGVAKVVSGIIKPQPLPNYLSSPEVIREKVYLTDSEYFCNKSWTVSYNLNTKSWISFHSYLPNWYIGESNFFYSGINDACTELDFIVGQKQVNSMMCSTAALQFDTYSTNLVGLLTVGNLISNTSMEIGDYLVEWHEGSSSGDIVFYSGIGTDPLIQALHPFTNEVVQSGVLYPTLAYVYIDGEKYSPYISEDAIYSPDLMGCLPEPGVNTIVVEEVGCNNGTFENEYYSHIFSYEALLDPQINASRTIKFMLNSDGSTNYFAWGFGTNQVADQIIISYVSGNTSTELMNMIVGTNAPDDFSSIPYQFRNGFFATVTDLTGIPYVSGDYLLIEIIPRVLEPETFDTIWYFYCKCLETFNADVVPNDYNTLDINTIDMIYNEDECRYELSIDTNASYWTTIPTDYYYFTLVNESTYNRYLTPGNITQKLYFPIDVNHRGQVIILTNQVCESQNDEVSITKVGNIVTYVFNNHDDYLYHKNSYINTDNYVATNYSYSSDNSNINHFYYWSLPIIIGEECGDSVTYKSILGHYGLSTFDFDDETNTIVFTIANTINNIVEQPCNNSYDYANNLVIGLDYYLISEDFSITTSIRYTTPIYPVVIGTVTDPTDIVLRARYTLVSPTDNIQQLIGNKWYFSNDNEYAGGETPGGRNFYSLDKLALRLVITDTNDPINNFALYNNLDENGYPLPYSNFPTCPKIYEKSGGVVVYPEGD